MPKERAESRTNGNGLDVHVTAGEVWLKFTPLTGPIAILNLEALVAVSGHLMREQVQKGIIAWCRETKVEQALDQLIEEANSNPFDNTDSY
jgi:hypothetical protein